MTATQTMTNDPAADIKLRGSKVKTPVGYREWELWLNLSTGEVYEKVRKSYRIQAFESGGRSDIVKPVHTDSALTESESK